MPFDTKITTSPRLARYTDSKKAPYKCKCCKFKTDSPQSITTHSRKAHPAEYPQLTPVPRSKSAKRRINKNPLAKHIVSVDFPSCPNCTTNLLAIAAALSLHHRIDGAKVTPYKLAGCPVCLLPCDVVMPVISATTSPKFLRAIRF